jgi:hypothetical protein
MDKKMLDIYSDFLFANLSQATATSFSDALDGRLSHDKFTRFLSADSYTSKTLWENIKVNIRVADDDRKAVLSFDDSIIEKPYTKENDINCWHYSHAKGRCVKGMNLLTALASYPDADIPCAYEIIEKPIQYCDLETRRKKRKSMVSKNMLMREMFKTSLKNINFDYVLADNWFCCGETLELINSSNKKFIFGIKSNRIIYKSMEDREKGNGVKLSEFDLEEGDVVPVFLNLLDFRVRIMKKVFTNENGSQGTLYLVTNDVDLTAENLYITYQRRWKIEVYHKSLKNNVSIAKSPTKTVRTQSNHLFASIYAFAKLESVKVRTNMNHFALKRKIQIEALKASKKEIERINKMAKVT